MRLSLQVGACAVALVDDRHGHHIEVLALRLQVSLASANSTERSLCMPLPLKRSGMLKKSL